MIRFFADKKIILHIHTRTHKQHTHKVIPNM